MLLALVVQCGHAPGSSRQRKADRVRWRIHDRAIVLEAGAKVPREVPAVRRLRRGGLRLWIRLAASRTWPGGRPAELRVCLESFCRVLAGQEDSGGPRPPWPD